MNKPNYPLAEQSALEVINNMKFKELPIDLEQIVNARKDLKMFTYTFFCEFTGWTMEEVIRRANSESGCCFYYDEIDKYIILYNDTIQNPGHIRWTIAHELGHYFLEHSKITRRSSFMRNALAENEYRVFESEANCFARSLLAPPAVLLELKPASPHYISEICHISFKASTHIYNFLLRGLKNGISYPSIKLFKNFIRKKLHSYICNDCSHTFIKEEPNFCTFCGGTNFEKGDYEPMLYRSIELTESHHAKVCPTCSNENITGDYCQICGIYLLNRCTGYEPGQTEYNYSNSRIFWHSDNNGCGELLSGDARFCSHCGSTSTFYEEGILAAYDVDSTKTQTVLIGDDEDLPF